jgi:precorrin-6A/cobalt-precorrin-6A reductase
VKVLLLGGTAEARQLAELLVAEHDADVVVSLAGHTGRAAPQPCPVRRGGFGGVDGLAAYLRATRTDILIDATHPFSMIMPANAVQASALVGIPTTRLIRPPWQPGTDDAWIDASDLHDASRQIVALGARRVLLTTGRLDLAPFAALDGIHFVVRSIEEPDAMPLPGATVIRERGPFDRDSELALLRAHAVDTVVTKNSGGPDGKLVAARQCGARVVMVRRPPAVPGTSVATAQHAVDWLAELGYTSSVTSR